jgi:hypothetical protein
MRKYSDEEYEAIDKMLGEQAKELFSDIPGYTKGLDEPFDPGFYDRLYRESGGGALTNMQKLEFMQAFNSVVGVPKEVISFRELAFHLEELLRRSGVNIPTSFPFERQKEKEQLLVAENTSRIRQTKSDDYMKWMGNGYLVVNKGMTKEKIAKKVGLSVEMLNSLKQNAQIPDPIERDNTKIWVIYDFPQNNELKFLSALAYSEGTNDPLDKYAVASIVINRKNFCLKHPKSNMYASNILGVIFNTTKKGGFEFDALNQKKENSKWKKGLKPEKLKLLTEIKEWNCSANAAYKALILGPMPELKGATVFHSSKEYGEKKTFMPGQISTRYWNWKYVTKIGDQYYFRIWEK